jgi:ribosomal-protein-alanine N-acetyltransferase
LTQGGTVSEPELLSPQDYSALAPMLATCDVANLDLPAEANKAWSRIWVLRDGAAQIQSFLLGWWLEDQVEVIHVATLPSARRQGLSRRLLRHLVTQMRDAAVPKLWLEVRRSNLPAVNLYQSIGFVVSRERKRYYADGEDALEMLLEVSAV